MSKTNLTRAETLVKVGIVLLRTVRARDNVTLTVNELMHDIAETCRTHGKPVTFGEARAAAAAALATFKA